MDAATIVIVAIIALGFLGALILPMRKAWNASPEPMDDEDERDEEPRPREDT